MQRAVSLSCRLFPGDRGSLTSFLQSPWSLAAPHGVPELVGPPGNSQRCRRQPSAQAAELDAASQPASEVSGCRHRADTEARSSQVLQVTAGRMEGVGGLSGALQN